VYDYELKIGWGKSVALPSQALPAPPPGHMAIRSKEVASSIPKFLCAANSYKLSGRSK
jgi:U2-associated protein SR140